MKTSKIRLAYRIVIDNSSTILWDKYVFEDTFKEYKMQQQLFNAKEDPKPTFRELLSENPKAEQLHYLTGIAASSYIEQLKGNLYRVPDVLGNNYFPFSGYKLDIINTDINDIAKHKIGITFYSPMLVLVDVIDHSYLVSKELDKGNGFETLMFPFQAKLAICYKET